MGSFLEIANLTSIHICVQLIAEAELEIINCNLFPRI